MSPMGCDTLRLWAVSAITNTSKAGKHLNVFATLLKLFYLCRNRRCHRNQRNRRSGRRVNDWDSSQIKTPLRLVAETAIDLILFRPEKDSICLHRLNLQLLSGLVCPTDIQL